MPEQVEEHEATISRLTAEGAEQQALHRRAAMEGLEPVATVRMLDTPLPARALVTGPRQQSLDVVLTMTRCRLPTVRNRRIQVLPARRTKRYLTMLSPLQPLLKHTA